jgi:hypothetical protein
MAKINGTLYAVYNDSDRLLYATGAILTIEQDLADITTKESGGNANHLQGLRKWDISFEGLYDEDDTPIGITANDIQDLIITGATEAIIEFKPTDPTLPTWTGIGTIKGMKILQDNEKTLGYSGSIRGSGGGLVAPVCIFDGNTVGWYDYMKGITKDGSNLVSVWADQSGLGHDLIHQAGYTNPLFSIVNGLTFNGSSDCLGTNTFTWNQPEFIYAVVNPITWASNGVIFDGNVANYGAVKQYSATPLIVAYNGGTYPTNAGLTLGSFHIIRCLFNGASSKLIVDGGTPTTLVSGAVNMAGFFLGVANGGSVYANFYIKEAICRKVTDSSGDEASIYAFLKAKYSL